MLSIWKVVTLKKNDHEWGESPEDCLCLVMAFIVVIILMTQCTGAWKHSSIPKEYIEEEEVTTYVTMDTCSSSLPNR